MQIELLQLKQTQFRSFERQQISPCIAERQKLKEDILEFSKNFKNNLAFAF